MLVSVTIDIGTQPASGVGSIRFFLATKKTAYVWNGRAEFYS
jgi:hypothetical protein